MAELLAEKAGVLRWFRFWNDLLLIPMFAMILLHLNQESHEFYTTAYAFFCLSFSLEWLWALYTARERRAFLKNPFNLIDLFSAIPFALIFPGIFAARFHEIVRIIRVFSRVSRWSTRAQELVKVVGVVLVTIITGAVGLQMVEPQTVPRFQDALWWAIVTMSTVGYGDITPVSGAGRVVASVLILFGFGVFGYVAGYVADLLRSRDDRTTVLLHRIDDRLRSLEQRISSEESSEVDQNEQG